MYVPVYLYAADGTFLGHGIKKEGAPKLQTANFWTDEQRSEFDAQLDRLNDQTNILAHWPHYSDPDVQRLLVDPTWEPVANEPVEVVDEANSIFVWYREPDEDNGDFGEMNEDASIIVTKTVMAPPPVLVQARVKKAQEIVARRRMGS